MSRDEIQNVTYRGKRYSFCINDVVAFPQDYAAAMTIYGKLKEYVKDYPDDERGTKEAEFLETQ